MQNGQIYIFHISYIDRNLTYAQEWGGGGLIFFHTFCFFIATNRWLFPLNSLVSQLVWLCIFVCPRWVVCLFVPDVFFSRWLFVCLSQTVQLFVCLSQMFFVPDGCLFVCPRWLFVCPRWVGWDVFAKCTAALWEMWEPQENRRFELPCNPLPAGENLTNQCMFWRILKTKSFRLTKKIIA